MLRKNRIFAVCYFSYDVNTADINFFIKTEKECSNYAKQCGLDVVMTYEEYLSECNSRRTRLYDMISFCCNPENKIKYVIINRKEEQLHSIDDFVTLAKVLDSCGIKILSIDGSHSMSFEDCMTQNMQWAIGQLYK